MFSVFPRSFVSMHTMDIWLHLLYSCNAPGSHRSTSLRAAQKPGWSKTLTLRRWSSRPTSMKNWRKPPEDCRSSLTRPKVCISIPVGMRMSQIWWIDGLYQRFDGPFYIWLYCPTSKKAFNQYHPRVTVHSFRLRYAWIWSESTQPYTSSTCVQLLFCPPPTISCYVGVRSFSTPRCDSAGRLSQGRAKRSHEQCCWDKAF